MRKGLWPPPDPGVGGLRRPNEEEPCHAFRHQSTGRAPSPSRWPRRLCDEPRAAAMSDSHRIHWLNTGWIESMPGVSLMGEGRHPAVPGGQLRSYGYTDDTRRPDGRVVAGTMTPAPPWYIEAAGRRILV